MAYVPTLSILTALKDVLTALQFPTGLGTGALFERVQMYDATDLARAFADAHLAREKRLCFLIPGGDTFARTREGTKLHCRKRTKVNLLICDSDRKTGAAALFGGPDNRGVVALADIVVEAITGAQLGLPWVAIEPEDGDDIAIRKEGESDSGRKGWLLTVATDAGNKITTVTAA